MEAKVEIVVSNYTKIESVFVSEIVRTTDRLVAKEIPTLVSGSLEEDLQWKYEKACMRTRSDIYTVVEQILSNLSHSEVVDETLNKYIANSFDTRDSTDNNFRVHTT